MPGESRLVRQLRALGVLGEGGGGVGPQGPAGESAYELAVSQGYAGTLEQWLASLVGAPGQDGAPGQNGAPGADGAPGAEWFSGSGAPAGGTGIVGDWYLNTANGDAYEKTGAAAWTLRLNLKGPQGDAGAGGGAAALSMPLLADAAGLALTNMAAALGFLGGSHRFATKADLTNFTQVRLLVNKQAVAGAAASKIILRYRTAFDATPANWSDIGASEVSCALNVQNTVLASAWINLVAGAKADVFIAPLMSGGDGALDPTIGNVVAQFR